MKCRGCKAEIEFVESPDGRRMPVQKVTAVYIAVVDGGGNRSLKKIPLSATYGAEYYVSHFQTCAQAERFSRRRA